MLFINLFLKESIIVILILILYKNSIIMKYDKL